MGNCYMRIDKIKNFETLTSKYEYDYRISDVINADKKLESHNKEINKLSNGQTYTDICKERIAEIEKSTGRKIRKDAVLALEIVTTFSRSALINVDEWKKVNEKWLKETFNKASDGKNNVISMVYHADEKNHIHCHSLVIPINDRGRLSARSFINGSKKMTQLQDSYAKAMKEVGLERSQKGTIATYNNISRLYADLDNILENIPQPEDGESAPSYKERILEDIKNIRASNLREYNEMIQETDRQISLIYISQKEKLRQEIKNLKTLANPEIKQLQGTINKLNDQFKELLFEKMYLEQSISDLNTAKTQLSKDYKRQNSELEHMKQLQDQLDKLSVIDPAKHQKIMDILDQTALRDDAGLL